MQSEFEELVVKVKISFLWATTHENLICKTIKKCLTNFTTWSQMQPEAYPDSTIKVATNCWNNYIVQFVLQAFGCIQKEEGNKNVAYDKWIKCTKIPIRLEHACQARNI
jgi:hypothetical protein